jgi:hypothetical protein
MLTIYTPADVYYGRGDLILQERQRIKHQSINNRKREYERFKLNKNRLNKINNLVLN